MHSGNYQKARLLIRLRNGGISCAHVDTGLVNRLLQVMTTTELNSFIEVIVDAVENPDVRSFCQRLKNTDASYGWRITAGLAGADQRCVMGTYSRDGCPV